MKKFFALSLALVLAVVLCACSGESVKSGLTGGLNVGKYMCTSVIMQEVELGGDGEYLELQNGGKCSFFLYESPDDGTWTLEGETLTITVPYADMDLVASGTLKDGVITMTIPELNNATLTFQKEGTEGQTVDAAEAEPAGDDAGTEPAEDEAQTEQTGNGDASQEEKTAAE